MSPSEREQQDEELTAQAETEPESTPEPDPVDSPAAERREPAEQDDGAPEPAPPVAETYTECIEPPPPPPRRRSLKAWVGKRAKKVVSHLYDTRADDIEQRARRAVGSAYRDQADDLEERAVRAMRQAIHSEADRIKEAIEHAVQVKKREVRLSLLVLVVASLLYLALYWFTQGQGAAS